MKDKFCFGSMVARPVAGALLSLVLLAVASKAAPATIHTIFTTECGQYFTWQSMGLVFSHRKAGQPGGLTRVMSCTPEEWAALSEEQRTIVPTHVAPSYTKHPRTGDVYSAYNKPVAVIDWLARNNVTEDYVLIIDADMIIRMPFTPEASGARPGRAVSAFFGYMKGVKNRLATKHIPNVLPRNDTLAGPKGRFSDQVGGFTLMNTQDLRRVAPLWLKYTEDVRADPDAWELSGDAYSRTPGSKPWISEMYGYSYACAVSDVWHICHHSAMLYPGYDVMELPMVLHYGLWYEVKNSDPKYIFDKHWHYGFDPLKCPPWDISQTIVGKRPDRKVQGGLFPHPPRPSSFKTKHFELLRDLLSVEVPITLNQAFCERHRRKCPPSEQLQRECGLVDEYAEELANALAALELPDPCRDNEARCKKWADAGECDSNPGYMYETCPKSCSVCTPRQGAAQKRPDLEHKEGAGLQGAQKVQSGDGVLARAGDSQAGGGVMQTVEAKLRQAGLVDKVKVQFGEKQQEEGQHKEDDDGSMPQIPELKLRCTRFPKWSAAQVKHCMTLAADGIAYDAVIDDPEAAATAADLHASAHHLLDRTHDVGRLLGEGLSRVHLRGSTGSQEQGMLAAGLGPIGVAAWGLAVTLLLVCVMRSRRRRKGGAGSGSKNGYQYGRHAFKYVRRED